MLRRREHPLQLCQVCRPLPFQIGEEPLMLRRRFPRREVDPQLCQLAFVLCPVHNAPFPRSTWFPSLPFSGNSCVSQRHPAERAAPQSPLPEGRACRHHTRTIVRPSSEMCARASGGSQDPRRRFLPPPFPPSLPRPPPLRPRAAAQAVYTCRQTVHPAVHLPPYVRLPPTSWSADRHPGTPPPEDPATPRPARRSRTPANAFGHVQTPECTFRHRRPAGVNCGGVSFWPNRALGNGGSARTFCIRPQVTGQRQPTPTRYGLNAVHREHVDHPPTCTPGNHTRRRPECQKRVHHTTLRTGSIRPKRYGSLKNRRNPYSGNSLR